MLRRPPPGGNSAAAPLEQGRAEWARSAPSAADGLKSWATDRGTPLMSFPPRSADGGFWSAMNEGRRILGYLVNGRQDGVGRRLMDHVAVLGNAMKPALAHVQVQPRGLRIGVNRPVIVARDDCDRHLQVRVFVAELPCVRDHQRRLRG